MDKGKNLYNYLDTALKKMETLGTDKVFKVKDLYAGVDWEDISVSDRLKLGTLFRAEVSRRFDVEAIEKTASGQQQYIKKNLEIVKRVSEKYVDKITEIEKNRP